MALLHVRVVTPEREALDVQAASLVFPAADGFTGVHPGHAAMISTVEPGELRYLDEAGKEQDFVVTRGFAEVRDDVVRFTVDTCERCEDIDAERAERAFARAQEHVAQGRRLVPGEDLMRAEYALKRALVRRRAKRR